MKPITFINLCAALALFVLTACSKNEDTSEQTITGTYVGTLKSSASTTTPIAATATVVETGDLEIELHCLSDELDTTLVLKYYHNDDSIMVCLTGDDFEHMYGHMLGQGHMMGGMMGDLSDGETEWMHHLNDEHQDGDEHFGGFDMQHHTFGYRFEMMDGDMPYNLTFQGVKE
ncbi:hypothetical protein [Mangrovibacterium lignilyticum]|uniref:hypothetical protein n=1 Tax=Mangrovibacterium lignilyticum TaxID=2668052 RepID=UPI0013D6F6D1|nr:hypothetical protein [Mangrovibacterium lignilyticum]